MKSKNAEVFQNSSAEIYSVEPKITGRTVSITDMLIQIVLSLAAAYSFVHVFTSAFELQVGEVPFLAVTLLLSLLMVLMVRGMKAGMILLLITMIGGGVILWLQWDTVIEECAGVYKQVFQAFGERYGFRTAGEYSVIPDTNVTIIMVCFSFIPVWLVSYTYGRKMYPVLCCVFLMLPLFLCLAGGVSPDLLPLGALAAVIFSVFASCRAEFINRNCVVVEDTEKTRRMRFVLISCLASALLIMLANYLIYPLLEDEIKELQDAYSEHFISDLLAEIKGNPLNRSKDGLTEGNLSEADSVVRNGETAIVVSFTKSTESPVYIRGYAGDDYSGRGWGVSSGSLPSSLFVDKMLKGVYSGDTAASSQILVNPFLYYQAASMQQYIHADSSKNEITITRENSQDTSVFMPYYLRGGIQNVPDLTYRNKKDLYFDGTAENAVVFPFYSYSGIKEVLTNVRNIDETAGTTAEDGTQPILYKTADDLYKLLTETYLVDISETEFYSEAKDYSVPREDGTTVHYRIKFDMMTEYEAYINEQCLKVPENPVLEGIAEQIMKEAGIETGESDISLYTDAVRSYLKKQAVYDLNPGKLETDLDPIEEFLTVKKKGYCVHFAAAGTLLLRYMGIPARYVEGYLCPSVAAGEQVRLTDYNAHAWVEVFIEGFGFVPVEMTPGDEDDEETTSETEAESTTPEAPTTKEEKTTKAHEETSSSRDEDREMPEEEDYTSMIILLATIVCFLLLMVFIILLVLRSHRIKSLENLEGEDNRETYLTVYEEIQKQAQKNGKEFYVDDSEKKLQSLYPDMKPEELQKLQNLSKEVYYSNKDVEEASVSYIYELYASKVFKQKEEQDKKDQS